VSLQWNYGPSYAFLCQAEGKEGFYTVSADEDRCGEPLFLEFHSEEDGYCTTQATTLAEDLELGELQNIAEDHNT